MPHQEHAMPSTGAKIATAITDVKESIDRSSTMASTMAAASDRVVETAGKAAEAGAMGIKGVVLNNIGNVAAMAIIAGMLIYLQREQISQAREDRLMFRESIKTVNDGADRRYEKSEVIHGKAMEKMGTTIERAVVSMEGATTALKEANRKNNP